MIRPTKAYPNLDKGTSTLVFGDQYREFYVLGGICWPTQFKLLDKPPDIMGYAIVAGKDLETEAVHVFEQREFVTIEHIFNSKQMVQYEGLAPWFNTMWSRYYCNKYYFNQPDELSRKHHLDIIRSQTITCRPQIIDIPMPDGKDALHAIWRHVKLGKLTAEKDTPLAEHMGFAKYDEKATPPVHALACLLVGLDRHPYRKAA